MDYTRILARYLINPEEFPYIPEKFEKDIDATVEEMEADFKRWLDSRFAQDKTSENEAYVIIQCLIYAHRESACLRGLRAGIRLMSEALR